VRATVETAASRDNPQAACFVARVILLTGGTGIVGNSIANELRRRGRTVRALVRSLDRGRAMLPDCELALGDVTDAASVDRAMAGCEVVYHAAGLPEQWTKDPAIFERVNVGGTRTVVEAAARHGVRRLVYTSTIDVFDVPRGGGTFDEHTLATAPKATAYQRSKQDADRIVASSGLPAVFLHPSAVYGPAPAASPGLNDFIADVVAGKVPLLLPGGMPLVFSSDVAIGHVDAEERARPGSRYILSESYWTLVDLATAVRDAAQRGRVPPVMPGWVAHAISFGGELLSNVLGSAPLIPRGQLHFLESNSRPDATRARTELGSHPLPLREALDPTLVYLAGR
jgi:dihydroflavonol-4-reductase